MPVNKYHLVAGFVGGALFGAALLGLAMLAAGRTERVAQDGQDSQRRIETLEYEITGLTATVERLKAESGSRIGPEGLPYDEQADAGAVVARARREAAAGGQFLMVTFGANWCMDCRTLHRHLKSPDVAAYTDGVFRFAAVDVGKFNRNRALAEELGVDLSRGIPVAIFFDREGAVIGTTNDGQLEPARRYSSKQILRFLRDVAERERVSAPDSVEP